MLFLFNLSSYIIDVCTDENRESSFALHSSHIDDARKNWELDQNNNMLRLQYAALLAQSSHSQDNAEASLHLQYLMEASYSLRETLYYLATLYYYTESYESAMIFSEELLKLDPDSNQIKNLHKAITYKYNKSKGLQRDQQEAVLSAGLVGVGLLSLCLSIFLSMRKK